MFRAVITCGDINGIGPELGLKTYKSIGSRKNTIVFVCPANVFLDEFKAGKFKFKFNILKAKDDLEFKTNVLNVIDIGIARRSIGKPTKTSGNYSYKSIVTALKIIDNGYADALITTPISKEAIGMAGFDIPGHTEMLADWYNVKYFLMMFVSSRMKAALMTIHEPIKNVSKLITQKKLQSSFGVILNSLKKDFNITDPKVAVLGLNPHAGENGKIGNEEKNKIDPAIEKVKENFFGSFVPDAFFGNKLYKEFDLVFGMYHDQVLIPFKMLDFSTGVNYTAGLPIVRTSPDHGTAFDIAGLGKADNSSMISAFKLAEQIVNKRKQNES